MDDRELRGLLRDYDMLAGYMENVSDHICFKDTEGAYARVNRAFAESLGMSPCQVVGRTDADLFPAEVARRTASKDRQVRGTAVPMEARIEEGGFPGQRRRWFSTTRLPWFAAGGAVSGTITVSRDVTSLMLDHHDLEHRSRLESVLSATLRLSLKVVPLEELLGQALESIFALPWMPVDPRGGVFLVGDDETTLVLRAQRGLSAEIRAACARLPVGTCLCGRAAQTGQIVFAESLDARHEITHPGITPHGHYCVPLLSAGRLLGVVALYVEHGHRRSFEEEETLRVIANALAGLVEHRQAAERIESNVRVQEALFAILHVSMRPIPLVQQLEKILELLFEIPWISFESKGSVFLVGDEPGVLELVAQRGLHTSLLEACKRLPFGTCLCGRAASTGKLVFRGNVDGHHEIGYDDMRPHGHYCVPILSGSRVLGVLNLYVGEGHTRSHREDEFLTAVGHTLAGIVERKRAEEALEFTATHDALTGLAGRPLFADRLGNALARAKRFGNRVSLLYLDLDCFKEINDTLGHEAGDLLLQAVARALLTCVRDADTVARMGGDEFTVILERTDGQGAGKPARDRIARLFEQPFEVAGRQLRVGASIGMGVFPDDGQDPEALLRHADAAMYENKRQRKASAAARAPVF